MKKIAFYLPQFYPTPENDEWWGKGFTEWTNVAKAKPLFPGHYQPRIPADLGFYDLRLPSVREEQVELAKEAGIDGFCYWHYWFNGRRLLDKVFTEVVESGKPDFPFCLCWANHSWSMKTWDPDKPNKLLIEQTYPGKDDFIAHFYAMLPAFRDSRYIRFKGKLLFGVFDPRGMSVSDTKLFIDTWNELAKKNGLGGFYFFGFSQGMEEFDEAKSRPYDSIVYDALHDTFSHPEDDGLSKRLYKRAKRFLLNHPYTTSYDNYIKRSLRFIERNDSVVPCIDPDFDHSPRSGGKWIIVEGSTPEKWGCLCIKISELLNKRSEKEQLLFIKAWNEWGEGNYLEPDLKWGKRYIEETNIALYRNTLTR